MTRQLVLILGVVSSPLSPDALMLVPVSVTCALDPKLRRAEKLSLAGGGGVKT